MMREIRRGAAVLLLLWCLLLAGCQAAVVDGDAAPAAASVISLNDIPPFSDEPYVEINGNEPSFLPAEMTTESYEIYSPLDSLGHCGTASACVGVDLMPTEKRVSQFLILLLRLGCQATLELLPGLSWH